ASTDDEMLDHLPATGLPGIVDVHRPGIGLRHLSDGQVPGLPEVPRSQSAGGDAFAALRLGTFPVDRIEIPWIGPGAGLSCRSAPLQSPPGIDRDIGARLVPALAARIPDLRVTAARDAQETFGQSAWLGRETGHYSLFGTVS